MSQVPSIAVTGATELIGSFVCDMLLEKGYIVHAVVDSSSVEHKKVAHLNKMAARRNASDRLKLFTGHLLVPGSFDGAFAGCAAVMHTTGVDALSLYAKNHSDFIHSSINGTRNVLDSIGRCSGIQKVVMTSSIATVINSKGIPTAYTYTEKDFNEWSTEKSDPYGFAKNESEKLALQCCLDEDLDLTLINTGVCLGPCLAKHHAEGLAALIRQILQHNPNFNFNSCFADVRDVARSHVAALTKPEDSGTRFIVVCDLPQDKCMLDDLDAFLPKDSKTPSTGLMNWLFSSGSKGAFQKRLADNRNQFSNTRAKENLALQVTPLEQTIRDMVGSMIENNWGMQKENQATNK